MPGITDVAIIPHTPFVPGGVAVRGQTFGQCIDAIRRAEGDLGPGHRGRQVRRRACSPSCKEAELPLTPGAAAGQVDRAASSRSTSAAADPLETNCAIADVSPDSAEIWSSLKSPIGAQEQIAAEPRACR